MISRVNLIPKTPLSESIKGLIPVAFVIMTMVLGLFFAGRMYLLDRNMQEIQAEVKKSEEVHQQKTTIASLVASLESKTVSRKEQLQRKREAVAKLLKIEGEKRTFSHPLFLIADVLPPTIRCKSISFSGRTGSLTGTALDYNDLVILVKKLQDDPLSTKVSLAVTDRDNAQKIEKIQFSIVLELS